MRVLRILTRPNLGGPMRQAVALWKAHAGLGIRTLLVVGRCDASEAALSIAATRIPEVRPDEVLRRGGDATGICVLDSLRRRLDPARDLRALRELRRIIAAMRPDVVHTHTSKAGVLGRLAARAERVPVIAHTFHGIVMRDYAAASLSGVARRIERFLARRSDLLFAVSDSCRDELQELGIEGVIRVVPPAVATAPFADADRDATRRRLGFGPELVALGFVGRLAPVKRPEHFAALIAALPEHVVGVVIGDGPLRTRLESCAGPRLRLLGATAAPEAWVAALDLLVLTSVREGFPVAGVEAAAAGVPVLGYDVPGVRDLDRALGLDLLVPPEGGVTALATRVRTLLSAGLPRVRASGAELARRCEPARVAATLATAYREAMPEPRP